MKPDELEAENRRPLSPLGFLLSAAELERLEKIVPGTVNRVLKLAEQQQKHRHSWENDSLRIHADEQRRSAHYALGFAVAALLCSVALGYLNQAAAASVVGGGTIATVVTAFLIGRTGPKDRTAAADP